MGRHTRRSVLAAGLAGAIAGCVGGSDDSPQESEEASDGTTNENESEQSDSEQDTTDAETNESADEDASEPVHEDYETTVVEVRSADDEVLGRVTAAIADTGDLRYLGLSDTESLPEDRGMLFVYDSVSDRTFVMREMDFPIDIIYADDEGIITEIHHARAPGPDEDGNELRYPGTGQYVLEVNRDWTTDRGIEAGDRLEFDLP